jgi:hypothetical protein
MAVGRIGREELPHQSPHFPFRLHHFSEQNHHHQVEGDLEDLAHHLVGAVQSSKHLISQRQYSPGPLFAEDSAVRSDQQEAFHSKPSSPAGSYFSRESRKIYLRIRSRNGRPIEDDPELNLDRTRRGN